MTADPLATDTLLPVTPVLGVVLGVLLLAAATVALTAGLTQDNGEGYGRAILTAGLRAVVQLGAVSLVIGWVVGALPTLLGFVLLMYAVAVLTAARRLTRDRCGYWVACSIGAGVLPVLLLLVGTGLVPLRGIALIPVAGILIGGALTATVLAGRRALEELTVRWGEVEAGLAIGLLPREAVLEVARPAAGGALLPGIDQTRTVGLVTLPGAFVGMLLGGASPLMAGAVQLFVLVALMFVQAVAVAVTLELIARDRLHRDGRRAR
ncbi:ABC transporter permease [Streptomyces durbertensis]|uniref:ABC transporter permease n=1 Tax=Streptomyces durbertensis TaxID=2448886 RepID=A0ABR6EJK7_9ACTN|nr:ABC transporter permease [Streptomyces durbertensis]MBB1245500.1 ABC transporter permease [Streptomyces durbertensis]